MFHYLFILMHTRHPLHSAMYQFIMIIIVRAGMKTCIVRAPIVENVTPNYLDSTRSKPQELLDYAIAESIEASKMPLVEPCVFEGYAFL